ncbi:hypothetical protein BBJ28_00009169 [Nothophytophthora sp. Chile5]|nr:hypothetical protein BBJ28_00009169 [Nothophytophthora sp. Chile5]
MSSTGERMEALLAVWEDATAPLDAKVRADPLLFASASEITSKSRAELLKTAISGETQSDERVCRPWDHADFLARVATFRIGTWFAKPAPISSFACARHGWRNTKPDQLQCACCEQILCFKIDARLSEAGALAVAKTFANQLISGHAQLLYEAFLYQFQLDVAWMKENIEWQRRLATEFSVDDAMQRKLLQGMHVHGAEEGQLDSNAFAAKLMALCCPSGSTAVTSKALMNTAFLIVSGWQFDVKGGDQRQVLWCESCNRRWRLFQGAIDTSKAESSEPPTKRVKMEPPHAVDCLAQHRQFCPWVTGRQSSLDEDQPKREMDQYGENDAKLWGFMKLPGWQQYAQVRQGSRLVRCWHSET